jgi:hypothetical protein
VNDDENDVVADAIRRLHPSVSVAQLVVRTDHSFQLSDPLLPTRVPKRGSIVDFGRWKQLLCVHGDTLRDHERSELPSPHLIELDGASTEREIGPAVAQLYQLTGMYAGAIHTLREPVTLYYVRQLAKRIARLDGARLSVPPPGRLHEHLWFL